MSIRCDMPKDMRKIETKVFLSFTARQLVCVIISLLYSVPIMLITPLPITFRCVELCILMMPVVLCGYVKVDGTHLEVLLMRVIYKFLLSPTKRKVRRKNLFRAEIQKQGKTQAKKKNIKYQNSGEFKLY